PDGVERDVDPARPLDEHSEMLVHRLLVESVDLGRLGDSTGGNDLLRDRFDRRPPVPGEEKLGPLARKGACDRAANGASGSVDHRNLVLQHHLWFLSVRTSMMQTPRRRKIGRGRTAQFSPPPVSIQDGPTKSAERS